MFAVCGNFPGVIAEQRLSMTIAVPKIVFRKHKTFENNFFSSFSSLLQLCSNAPHYITDLLPDPLGDDAVAQDDDGWTRHEP